MVAKVSGNVASTEDAPIVNARCPICGVTGAFHRPNGARDVQWMRSVPGPNRPQGQIVMQQQMESAGLRQCPNAQCGALVFVAFVKGRFAEMLPPSTLDFDGTNLPAAIRNSLEEAIKCHSAGCFKASALMVRRTLEEMCADKGANGASLKQRLGGLKSTIVISEDLLQAADELRLLGNDAAHIEAQTYDAIGAEEVEVAIDLTKELLKAVYQHTSLVARLRALRGPAAPPPR